MPIESEPRKSHFECWRIERQAAIANKIAATMTANAMTRFENSISPWNCMGGVALPSQRGQSGQPRPEFVTRTRAPETMLR